MKHLFFVRLLIGFICSGFSVARPGIASNDGLNSHNLYSPIFFEYRPELGNILKLQVTRNVVTLYFHQYSQPRVNTLVEFLNSRPDLYQFIFRDDDTHQGLHKNDDEAEIDHLHISYAKLAKIDAASLSRLLRALVLNGQLEGLTAENMTKKFATSRYSLLTSAEDFVFKQPFLGRRAGAYSLVGFWVWEWLRALSLSKLFSA